MVFKRFREMITAAAKTQNNGGIEKYIGKQQRRIIFRVTKTVSMVQV